MIGVDANVLVRYAVKDDPQQTAQATDILGLPNVVMQNAEHVVIALDWYEVGMDFADALHMASCYEAEQLNISHKVIFLQTEQK